MFKYQVEQDLKKALAKLGVRKIDIVLSISKNQLFGDYSTNVALQLPNLKSKNIYHSSIEAANDLIDKFGHPYYLERIEVAGAGFINFFLKDKLLIKEIKNAVKIEKNKSQRILLEYASPNAFKPLHIGHLRNIVIGESIARLLKIKGNEIFKVSYTSDIGLATAKAIWGILNQKEKFNNLEKGSTSDKAIFLGQAYVLASNAYEEKQTAKKEIEEINRKLYQGNSELLQLWKVTRSWSEAYLDNIYELLGTKFDAIVWESETGEIGKKIVEKNIGKVFKKDQGAVIFPGEKYGLHTRVFINSDGNPTYEAKELGVTKREMELFPFDEAIHVVANEQSEYFKVVIKVVELIEKRMEGRKKHLSYGFVNLTSGKMSSRKGNIVGAEDLIKSVIEEVPSNNSKLAQIIALGAIKFYLLKFSTPTDITFDIKKSISLQGDSGPYVMYAYVRCLGLIQKSKIKLQKNEGAKLENEERELLRQLEYFDYYIEEAADNFSPNTLCNYLLDLAKAFNLFYERYPILGSNLEQLRISIVTKTADTIKLGMELLGIEVPNKM